MENGKLSKRKRGKSIVKVSRETVSKAVDEYLKQGGKITFLETQKESVSKIAVVRDSTMLDDEQLSSL